MTEHVQTAEKPSAEEIAHVKQHVRQHFLFGGLLMFLSVLTVYIAQHPFSPVGNIAAALAIAGVEAGFVAWFFMHLSKEKRGMVWGTIFTVHLALLLIILTVLGYFDHIHGSLLWP